MSTAPVSIASDSIASDSIASDSIASDSIASDSIASASIASASIVDGGLDARVGARRRAGDEIAVDTLKILDEPLELLASLRVLALGEPAAARSSAPSMLAAYAGDTWADQLDALGVPVAVVTRACESIRREIWLWVDGDRRWDQLSGHLAARVLRRA